MEQDVFPEGLAAVVCAIGDGQEYASAWLPVEVFEHL